MGRLALAAKITHVPSMYLSEQPGPHQGCRQAAIDGHHEIGRRCRALGVDNIVVLDTHDTAMLLGLLGPDACDQPAEVITLYFTSSGTGQINAVLPL